MAPSEFKPSLNVLVILDSSWGNHYKPTKTRKRTVSLNTTISIGSPNYHSVWKSLKKSHFTTYLCHSMQAFIYGVHPRLSLVLKSILCGSRFVNWKWDIFLVIFNLCVRQKLEYTLLLCVWNISWCITNIDSDRKLLVFYCILGCHWSIVDRWREDSSVRYVMSM